MRLLQKKVCILGSFAVGKTSLVRRFTEGRFDEKYLSTIGVQISRTSVTIEGKSINLILWDLAGDEPCNGLCERYLQGTAGVIIVCDLTRPDTLAAWHSYTERLREVIPYAKFVLVANKSDLVDERAIDSAEREQIAATLGYPVFTTSAKTGENVDFMFTTLARDLLCTAPATL